MGCKGSGTPNKLFHERSRFSGAQNLLVERRNQLRVVHWGDGADPRVMHDLQKKSLG